MGINEFESLTMALESLKRRGFTDSFTLDASGAKSTETGRAVNPEDATVMEYHRFEGNSNPDDMSVVYAIEFKNGNRGIFIDAYGTYADALATEFVMKLKMRKGLR